MTPYPQPSQIRRLGSMFNASAWVAVTAAASGNGNPPPAPVRPRDKKGTLRLAVPVNFAGTIWPQSNPATGNDRQPMVNSNQERLRDAVLVLSQSPTGRELMRTMTLGGYKIVFDDDYNDKCGSVGLCDSQNRRIRLRSTGNLYELALVLAHESVHACQAINGDLIPNDKYRVDHAIRLSFAIEADAHAQVVQMALELAYGDMTRHSQQILFPEALISLRETCPGMVKAAEEKVKTRADLESGVALASAFEAFYSDIYLRFYYEDSHVAWCEERAAELAERNPSLRGKFCETLNSSWIKDNLTWQGSPYLHRLLPGLSLDDARHSGLTGQTIEAINAFYEDNLPAEQKPVLKKFSLRQPKPKEPKTGEKPPFPPAIG